MKELRLHPEVEPELLEAWSWYDKRSPIAADAFALEIDRALANIMDAPLRWPRARRGERRFVLDGFPYTIIYRVLADSVFVTAVAHQSRRPEYWKHRR
jgi:toxin ParE1/3/4